MRFQAALLEAMANYLYRRCGIENVAEVTAFEDGTEGGGYCETCAWEEAVVYIDYTTSDGTKDRYTYRGDLGELIRALTD